MDNENNIQYRRQFLRDGVFAGVLAALGAAAAAVFARSKKPKLVWQLNPLKCIACGKCATHCVLNESAVKCVHAYAMCGYCDLCTYRCDHPHLRRGPVFPIHHRRTAVRWLRQMRRGL